MQGRPLSADEMAFVERVERLETNFAQWQTTKASAPKRTRQQNQLLKALLKIQQQLDSALQQARQLRN